MLKVLSRKIHENPSDPLPFELRCVEAICFSACYELAKEFSYLQPMIQDNTTHVINQTSGVILETLRQARNSTTVMVNRSERMRKAFELILGKPRGFGSWKKG